MWFGKSPYKGRVAETFSLKSSWEEGHGENSKFFIVSMKEESVRVKNGCGKLLRACFSAKVSIKEGWKGLAEVMMRRGVDGESGGADGQCGARRCSPTNREPSFVRARWHTGAPSWVVVVVGVPGQPAHLTICILVLVLFLQPALPPTAYLVPRNRLQWRLLSVAK